MEDNTKSNISTQGKYTVPPEIRALKPKNVSCTVKKIDGHYYVYEHLRVEDPKRPGKKKNATGKYMGTIADGKYIPYGQESKSITDEDPDNLNYGPYGIAMACSSGLLDTLKKAFNNTKDAITIYVIAIIYFVNHYVCARDLHEVYMQSVLCKLYTMVNLSENVAGDFIKALGNHSKKRLKFEQLLIDDGSGKYNIDGHVILCCSVDNELADYGSKYQNLGNTQSNFMMIYDAEKKRGVACTAFEGGISDKTEVVDVIESHKFKNARFRIDSGFYSEGNMKLFRQNECIFTIPVPATTTLRKTILNHLAFEGSFIHQRKDSHGKDVYSSVQYKEYTVGNLEKTAEEDAVADSKKKEEDYLKSLGKDEKPSKRFYPKKIEKSQYGTDRVIAFKDQLMHDKLAFEYKKNIGDGKHTEEEYEKLEPQFGVIVLRTNDLKQTPSEVYVEYKNRWGIETYYNYVKNGLDLNGLHSQDYYVQQGIGFLTLVEGQIYSEVLKRIQEAKNPYIKNMSVEECIRVAGRLKLAQHPDNTWHQNSMKGKVNDLFAYFCVDIKKTISELNSKGNNEKIV